MQGLFNIVLTIACILLAWWSLRVVRIDRIVKDVKSPQSKLIQVILAIVLGHELAQFLIAYSQWSSLLKGLF
jgi:uncharacterized integral membrane protein (TIGR02327 family)